ncbi:hypothetical protein [Streptomyces tritici]|uniref:hypothetical protein n=1 Tax=Streptomyces tritici TaxID=2054410 RepID=UPI003AF051A0
MTRPRAHVRVAVIAAALALGVTGCSQAPQASQPEKNRGAEKAERVIEGHSYKVDSGPAAAAAFPMNANVFEGKVVALKPDVRAVDKLDDGSEFEVVYTPVVIRVTTVHKGTLKPGADVVVRSMGGTADGVTYRTEEAPAKETFAKGRSLFVFGGALEAVDSETAPAITPHFVYRESGAAYVDATYASGSSGASVSKSTLRSHVGVRNSGS